MGGSTFRVPIFINIFFLYNAEGIKYSLYKYRVSIVRGLLMDNHRVVFGQPWVGYWSRVSKKIPYY